MVQSSEERLGNDAADGLDRPRNRRIRSRYLQARTPRRGLESIGGNYYSVSIMRTGAPASRTDAAENGRPYSLRLP